jgi:hypothetical protein
MLIIMPKVIIIYETLSTFTILFFSNKYFAHHIIKVKLDLLLNYLLLCLALKSMNRKNKKKK